MPAAAPKVTGPWRACRDSGKPSWRATVTWPDGAVYWLRRPTPEEAMEAAREMAAAAKPGVQSVEQAIAEFCALRHGSGAWGDSTLRRAKLDLCELVVEPGLPVTSLDRAALLAYLERTKNLALGSRKTRWATIAAFLRFCVAEGWLQRSPAELIDVSRKPWCGKRAKRLMGRGKAQLRNMEEVQRYIAKALERELLEERVAALLPLLCGMRSGEVLHLTAADVDQVLGVLHVRDQEAREYEDEGWAVKSVAGRRAVYIPALLSGFLARLVSRETADWLLFGHWSRSKGAKRRRVPHSGRWLADLVEDICSQAGVRHVRPHGLRGTYMTVLAVVGKVAPMDIARLVGHADAGETARQHYLGAAAPEPAINLGTSPEGPSFSRVVEALRPPPPASGVRPFGRPLGNGEKP